VGNRVAIHCNPGLSHQVEAARCLKAGFTKHGIASEVTDLRTTEAEIHVCLGPWYALNQNIGKRVFYLDRALWGDPDCVSLQWLDSEGNKVYWWGNGGKRPHPDLKPPKGNESAVVLCDYGMKGDRDRCLAVPHFETVSVRSHPSEKPEGETLLECLQAHDVAIGRHSTAMVQAAIEGLAVVCRVPHSPVTPIASRTVQEIRHTGRESWINDLAWHNWNLKEIESGDAWQHLSQ
jgi:hypothetical protein